MPKYFKDTIIMMRLEWQDVQTLNISGTDPEGPLDRDFKIFSMQYHLFLILKDLFFKTYALTLYSPETPTHFQIEKIIS